jgi:hypothetical protein
MKLFLTWLLGVPVLVLAMVLARAMSPNGLHIEPRVATGSACARQGHLQHVPRVIVKNGHRITCERTAIK